MDGQDHLSRGSLRHGRLSQSGVESVDGGLGVFARSRSARSPHSGELEKLINECLAEAVVHQTFVHRDDGKRYTYDGISCMFRRYVKKCGLKHFGFYDLKGKAATDMYHAGVPRSDCESKSRPSSASRIRYGM